MANEADDTATEPETDDEPVKDSEASARTAVKHIFCGCSDLLANANLEGRPPQRGTQAPPPSREATLATVLDAQLSNTSSRSLGDPIPPRPCSLGESPSLLEVASFGCSFLCFTLLIVSFVLLSPCLPVAIGNFSACFFAVHSLFLSGC
jgi:hypothetical protein